MNQNEIYTYTYNQINEGSTEINYIQLKNNNYNTYNQNITLPLLDNRGNPGSYLYDNKNIQQNILNNSVNVVNLFTLVTKNGSLIFLFPPDAIYPNPFYKTIIKPVFKSGYYSEKNIEIIFEVLNDVVQTRQISIIFL